MLHGIIPINDLGRRAVSVKSTVETAVSEVLASGIWLNGPFSEQFSRLFAATAGTSGCVLVGNGSDALEIALQAAIQVKQPEGREVITVANAGGYTTIACRKLGLTPVYVDIELSSQLMSQNSVVGALSNQTAAIVATHLYGGVVDISALRIALDAAGYGHLAIIEDCAQAHGAQLEGSPVGSMGDLATFSFYPTKNLGAFGDAGAIVSSKHDLLGAVARLRQYGWSKKYSVAISGGRNSRMDELQAAILCKLLPLLGDWNERRKRILQQYRLAAASSLSFSDGGPGSVAHLAIVLCDERDLFRRYMSDRGVQTDIHYPILDVDQEAWVDHPMRIAGGGLDVSMASVSRIVTLPCFPEMTDDEVSIVCDALQKWA